MRRTILLLGLAMGVGVTAAAWGQTARAAAQGSESRYAGSEACQKCHANRFEEFKHTAMGRIFFKGPRTVLESRGCESCHGPAQAHVDYRRAKAEGSAPVAREVKGGGDGSEGAGGGAPDNVVIPTSDTIMRFGKTSHLSSTEQNGQCLQCHEKGARLFWKGSVHESRGITCVTCHQMMGLANPTLAKRFQEPLSTNKQFTKSTQMEVCFQCHPMRKAQMMRSAHMPFREGQMTCTNCHNPHGTANPKLLVAATVNDVCYQCHAERRGPFLWEHPPVMESCLNCHDAHGSNNPQLLKIRTPRLCQQCHVSTQHPSTPQLATARFVFNRGCTNCHSEIHGSNHPSGPRFHR